MQTGGKNVNASPIQIIYNVNIPGIVRSLSSRATPSLFPVGLTEFS